MISSRLKCSLAVAALAATAISGAQSIQVEINGDAVIFPDVQPRMVGTVVMVPLRTVIERMGGTIGWDQTTQTATCNVDGKDIVLNIANSEATVDGQMRYLDLPPRIVGDRTLVPMRLFGDTLGNTVAWNADTDLLAITTNSTTSASTDALHVAHPVVVLSQNEVLPTTLDTPLDSTTSQVGDSVSLTVDGLSLSHAEGQDGYADIPRGTKIEGHVASVEPMADGQPAIIDLTLDRMTFPNGNSVPIDGSLVSLDTNYVMVGDDGTYHAQEDGQTFQRMVFVGYGLPNGLLVGINDPNPLDATTLAQSQYTIETQIPEDEHQMMNISLPAGTEIGVRINRDDQLRP